MSQPSPEAAAPPADPPPLAPEAGAGQLPEFSVRAVVVGLTVAFVIGASYPYVVLKLGFGPNISVVSAFFGYLALAAIGFITGLRGNRYENNLVQTAGTAAGQAGFMCVLLAAFDMLRAKPELAFNVEVSRLSTFIWLSIAGCLGVLLAVPLRKHYIDEEQLTFADGTAAGETLVILHSDAKDGESAARPRVWALGIGLCTAGLFTFVRDGLHRVMGMANALFPAHVFFGATGKAMRVGMDFSLLSFGSGLLVGLRITLSMGLGMVISWMILPGYLVGAGMVKAATFGDVLKWVMWPATGLMVAGGLTALALKWRVVYRTFANLSLGSSAQGSDFPIRGVIIGSIILTVALCVFQNVALHQPIHVTLIALLFSMPLMLVGTRVLGETNWAPISTMANMMQAVLAGLWPGNVSVNMVASGMSGSVAANGEHLMQDYKAGRIVGSNNRHLTTMQLLATPVGALAVALVYPVLKQRYGIGEKGLSSPISVKWAGFAELLSKGFDQLPPGCLTGLIIAVVAGIVIAVGETRWKKFLPSPTGVGIGMLIPAFVMMPMVLGGIVQYVWQKASPKSEDTYNTPLASGLIAGEALLAVILPLLLVLGLMK